MKVSVKYLDSNAFELFPNLQKDYKIYVNESGYPVIDVLDTEIPVYGVQHQQFTILKKLNKIEDIRQICDRNGNYNLLVELNPSKEAVEFAIKAFDSKRKADENKILQEKAQKKAELKERLKAGKEAKKKSEE